jgi:hypothetical protein
VMPGGDVVDLGENGSGNARHRHGDRADHHSQRSGRGMVTAAPTGPVKRVVVQATPRGARAQYFTLARKKVSRRTELRQARIRPPGRRTPAAGRPRARHPDALSGLPGARPSWSSWGHVGAILGPSWGHVAD